MIERGQPRTLVEKLIREGDYTIEEWRARFHQLAREMKENATLSARQLQRWMAGEVDDARPSARRVAAQLWGYPFPKLLAPPGATVLPVPPVLTGNVVMAGTAVAPRGRESEAAESNILEEATIMAAHESSRHAAQCDGAASRAIIEQIQAEVARLARDYTSMPPLRLLAESRQARNLTYMALDRTRRPAQTTELYLAAGQLCGLMAVASFDLAVWDAAAEQARAAHVYAELVDHNGLRAWARGTQALIAYWTGRPRHALVHIEAGLDRPISGTAKARLRSIEARAWSHIGGDPGRATAAIKAADAARDAADGQDDLHDEIAGEFGWGLSRHAACAGNALLALGDAAGAAQRARLALDLLPDDPFGGLVAERAQIDLAAAELALGHLDAAEEALRSVWALPVVHRRHGLTDRLAQMARALSSARWNADRQAAGLRDRIEVFNIEAEARALPSA